MAKQAQLLLLKDKLRKIRRDKRNLAILGTAISVIYFIIIEQHLKDLLIATTASFAWIIIGVILYLTVIRQYNATETKLIGQIKQLTTKSPPDNEN